MDATARDLRQLSETLDFLEDLLAPGGGEDLSEVLGGTLRECQELRDRLQDSVPDILDRDGGEATFNQIAALLERMERVKDQWAARGSNSSHAGAGGAGGAGGVAGAASPGASPAAPSLPSLPASALTSAASLPGPAPGPPGASTSQSGTQPGLFEASAQVNPLASPVASHAASSDRDRFEKEKSEKKKKRKEGKDSKDSRERDRERGDSNFDGFAPSAWPSGPSGPSGEAFPDFGTTWAGADVSAAAPFDAWGDDGTLGSGPTGPSFAAFGRQSSPGAPSPQGTQGTQGAQGADVPADIGFTGFAGAAQGVTEYEAPSQRSYPATQASLHIQYPYAAVDDKDAFQRLFVRAAAQAAGVPPQRIRVHAIRPGSY
ncbi:unnamed protein product [Symbiodinium natans]|uniref:Uncharacterized protein n=1 Tax=Symbiodinium natans TaxID=878477 RepID=A0A812IKH1_9DINO|nr:unnamed protein product [Symbiodinium natans]